MLTLHHIEVSPCLSLSLPSGQHIHMYICTSSSSPHLSGSGRSRTLWESRVEVETRGPHPAPCEPRHLGAACWSQELGPPDQIRPESKNQ